MYRTKLTQNRHEDVWDITMQPVAFLKIDSFFIGRMGQNLRKNPGHFQIIFSGILII
jgi:hypothetical protein